MSPWKYQLKYPPSGTQVYDVDHRLWDVREARATKHGFDLLFGSPSNIPLGSLPHLIATQELKNYWERNRYKCHGEVFDLPAGRTTLKRVRRRLGFNVMAESRAFFRSHIDELKSLTAREFADRYGFPIYVVHDRRLKLLGRLVRPIGWWRDPQVSAILLAPGTLRAAGDKLGIQTSQVGRLRRRVQEELGQRDNNCLLAA